MDQNQPPVQDELVDDPILIIRLDDRTYDAFMPTRLKARFDSVRSNDFMQFFLVNYCIDKQFVALQQNAEGNFFLTVGNKPDFPFSEAEIDEVFAFIEKHRLSSIEDLRERLTAGDRVVVMLHIKYPSVLLRLNQYFDKTHDIIAEAKAKAEESNLENLF